MKMRTLRALAALSGLALAGIIGSAAAATSWNLTGGCSGNRRPGDRQHPQLHRRRQRC